jgi:hypothetical protein
MPTPKKSVPSPRTRTPYRNKDLLATFAGQTVELRADDFFAPSADRELASVEWHLDGGGATASKGILGKGLWRKPGTYKISATLNGMKVTKQIVVGINPKHLIESPGHFEFFYCLVTVLEQKVYFLPIRHEAGAARTKPAGPRQSVKRNREEVLREFASDEPAYRDYARRQDEVYACQILQYPHIDPKRFLDGVYAVFDDRILFLGSTDELAAGLRDLRLCLDFDAKAAENMAQPDRVFSQINALIDSFDPGDLIGRNSDFLSLGSTPDRDGGWVARNIGTIFDAHDNYASALGLDARSGGIGSMFGFNTKNATFSSRFSDPGLGISRQSTNMLDFSGGVGQPGRLITKHDMVSDGEEPERGYGGDAYWDSTANVLVLGARSPAEIKTIDGAGVNANGDVVVVVNTPGTGGTDGSTGGTGTGTSGTSTGGTSTGGTSTGGTSTGGTSTGGTSTGGTSTTGTSTSGTSTGGTGTNGTNGTTGGTATGGPERPFQDDGGGTFGVSPRARRFSVSDMSIRQRGGGYTDPNPDYDGAGGGTFAFFVGYVCPLLNEWGPLVNPVRDGTSGKVGVGVVGLSTQPGSSDSVGAGSAGSSGVVGGFPGPGGYGSFDDVCGSGPRRSEPIDMSIVQQMAMEKVQGHMPVGVEGGKGTEASGLFGMARSFSCSGYSAKPLELSDPVTTMANRTIREQVLSLISGALAARR